MGWGIQLSGVSTCLASVRPDHSQYQKKKKEKRKIQLSQGGRTTLTVIMQRYKSKLVQLSGKLLSSITMVESLHNLYLNSCDPKYIPNRNPHSCLHHYFNNLQSENMQPYIGKYLEPKYTAVAELLKHCNVFMWQNTKQATLHFLFSLQLKNQQRNNTKRRSIQKVMTLVPPNTRKTGPSLPMGYMQKFGVSPQQVVKRSSYVNEGQLGSCASNHTQKWQELLLPSRGEEAEQAGGQVLLTPLLVC